MEPETTVQPTTIVEPAPPVVPPANAPKKTSKLLYAFIGFAVILFSIALAIVFFGKGTTTSSDTNTSSNGEVTQDTSAWPTYQNVSNF